MQGTRAVQKKSPVIAVDPERRFPPPWSVEQQAALLRY